MNLNERFNVIAQAVEISQKSGIMTLDDAVAAKSCIDSIQKGEKLHESFDSLVKMCENAQKNGVFNLRDAHIVYLATENISEEIDKFIAEAANAAVAEAKAQPAPQPEAAAEPVKEKVEKKKTTKKSK